MPGNIAAQVMAWQRRMGGIAGPLAAAPSGSGDADNGTPVQVEMLVSGTWVDITSYTLVRDDSGQIAITSGIRDEGSQTEAGTCSLELDNRDGRFSPRNPSGPYYGIIGRNTPVRVSVPDGMGGKSYRIWGEASEWVPNWDTSGTDVWTDLSASGILRRLAQAPTPERSPIYEAIANPPLSGLVAYWPCEDTSGATSVAAALPAGGSPMKFTGSPTLAAYTGFVASDPLPTFTGASLTGGVFKYGITTVTQYQMRFFLAVPTAGLSNGDIIARVRVTPAVVGDVQYFDIEYNDPPGGVGSFGGPGTISVLPYNSEESLLGYSGIESITMDVRSRLLRVSLEVANNGTALSVTLRTLDINTGATDATTIGLTSTNVTQVESIALAPSTLAQTVGATGMAAGHVTLQTTITPISDLGTAVQPTGETAGRRIQRLCDEEGIAFTWIGDLDDTVTMGPPGKANTLTRIQECVLADGGMLYENPGALGLGYRTRASLYNQDPTLTLDYTAGQLAQIPVPVEDDRYVQNKVTVTCNGVSATYEETSGALGTALPPAGVGTYGQDVTLNLASSDSETLLNQAAWRVHLGTVDEARFPQISVNLAHPSISPDMRRAILGMRIGDRIQITNPPAWLPPDTIDQLVLGTSETITHFEHRLTFNCQPASPYSTIGYTDSSTARVDTDGSALLSAASSSATSLVVAPTTTPPVLWTTDSAEFPFDIRVGGEVMRVTGVTSWLSDTFTRTVSNGWGSADTGQAWTVAGGATSDFAVSSGAGTHTLTSLNVAHLSLTDTSITDFDLYCDVAVSATATGGSIWAGPLGRYQDSENYYQARLEFDTSSTLRLEIRKRVDSVEGVIGVTYVMSAAYTAGVFYRVRFQAQGASLKAKVWRPSNPEPDWQVTGTDGAFSTTTSFGARSILSSANTNPSPVVSFENYQVASPQTFTVTRSINGVVKAQTAGTDVRLAYPAIIAL
ncbi:hypothetical protein [Streptomyces sp. NPDC004658]|uniref:hypothetical protein n=1 Tax=Streptomyces sp. NPDC004658 TaxID=3154672 RepID=UPI0033B50D5D